ncbi:hypothetical protein, partial [Sulfurimonas sp. NWX79]|uniref:hypothetical protein n=1 Tax=Sulfurimonas sp. NWX79 TaxID=2925412 RepID=UPI003204B235
FLTLFSKSVRIISVITVRFKTVTGVRTKTLWVSDLVRFLHKGKVLQKHFAYDREQIVQKTKSITNGEYEFIDDHYINADTKHTFKHITCATEFNKTWNKFRGGQRCPNCIRRGMDSMTFPHSFIRFFFKNFIKNVKSY